MLRSCDREQDPSVEIVPVPAFRTIRVLLGTRGRPRGRRRSRRGRGALPWLSRTGARLNAVLLTHHHRDPRRRRWRKSPARIRRPRSSGRPRTRTGSRVIRRREGDVVPFWDGIPVIAVPGTPSARRLRRREIRRGPTCSRGTRCSGATIGTFRGHSRRPCGQAWSSGARSDRSPACGARTEYTLDNVRLAAATTRATRGLDRATAAGRGPGGRGERPVPVRAQTRSHQPVLPVGRCELCAPWAPRRGCRRSASCVRCCDPDLQDFRRVWASSDATNATNRFAERAEHDGSSRRWRRRSRRASARRTSATPG